MIPWFKIPCYYPVVSDFYGDEGEVDDALVKSYLPKKTKVFGSYLIGDAVINLGVDQIARIEPGYFVLGEHHFHYSIIIFYHRDPLACPLSPEEVEVRLSEYYSKVNSMTEN